MPKSKTSYVPKWLNFSADDAAGISGDALSVSDGSLSISNCSTVGFKGAASIGVIGKAVSEAASSSVDAVSCF